MKICSHDYSREELLRRCNPDVLYGARRVELTDGRGRGSRLIEVKTPGGLRASFWEDRCLDIVDLEFCGVNLAFLSKNGLVADPSHSAEVNNFFKYWQGGFLLTCGLRNTGPPCEVGGEFFPLHGQIGLTPAEEVNVLTSQDGVTITGRMRETALFGHNLQMTREIKVSFERGQIVVKDKVENLSPVPEPLFLLYHINFGFPFLGEELALTFPKGEVRGRTDLATEQIGERLKIVPPVDGGQEVVYFYTPDEKAAQVILANSRAGVEAKISYDSERLPVLAQWKSMAAGDYALGIEPGTSHIRGRKDELADGYDLCVPAFEALEFGFTADFEKI